MVAEISVVARVLATGVLPRDHGRAVRGWAYHLINAGDPDLADELHRQGGTDQDAREVPAGQKPFTCSELLDTHLRADGLVALDAGQAVRIRLTTLNARVLRALDAAFATSDPDFTLAVRDHHSRRDRAVQLQIVDIAMPRRVAYAEFGDLAGSKQWRLRFLSRTAFSSSSGDQMPDGAGGAGARWLMPIPRLILANLTMKWNQFAAQEAPRLHIDWEELERALHASLVVSRVHELWTEPDAADLGQRGFRGAVDLQLLGDLSGSLFRRFTALMHFAPFAGVGERTTEGWGQVVVERLRP